jgi:four helix bundle protein
MSNEMNLDSDKGLEALQVWKDAMRLAVDICKTIIPLLPPEEKYALASQMRRSLQSIPANIAEGHGRYYYQEGIHFCYIARGSLEETKTQVILAHELEYLDHKRYQEIRKSIETIRRQLNGYILYLKNSKRGASEPGYKIREHLQYQDDYLMDHDDNLPSPIDPSPVD